MWPTYCDGYEGYVPPLAVRSPLVHTSSWWPHIYVDNKIKFISCSATLANPAEYMSRMFCLDIAELDVVNNDGAPSGSKQFLLWNPPLLDDMNPALGRRSSLSEASNLMRTLMRKGLRVILFCKVRWHQDGRWLMPNCLHFLDPQGLRISKTQRRRKTNWILMIIIQAMKTIKSDLSNEGRQDIIQKIRAYRGGRTYFVHGLLKHNIDSNIGYSHAVRSSIYCVASVGCDYFDRTAEKLSKRPFRVACLELLLQMLSSSEST